MNTYLHKQFDEQFNQLTYLDSALIAISGGQDSLCLAKLMQDFIKKHKYLKYMEYIYIDHQWKRDSKYQITHLINYITQSSHKISIYQIKKLTSSELEARCLRYEILIQHALKNQYSTIITAHTKTDKIETFFQQLIRGTSLDGATSLTSERKLANNLKLLRPLIKMGRLDINWFCRKFCLPIWSDITNYQYNIQRNRLRYELIPYLNEYFMLDVESNIGKFLYTSNIDNEYIKQNAIKLYLISRHKISIAFNCIFIKKQHTAIQMRTLQIFFYHHFNKPLDKKTLCKIIKLIYQNAIYYNKIQWNQLIIHKYNNWIYIN